MIIMAVLYIALVIYARRKDRKDIEKVRPCVHHTRHSCSCLARRHASARQSSDGQVFLSDLGVHRLSQGVRHFVEGERMKDFPRTVANGRLG